MKFLKFFTIFLFFSTLSNAQEKIHFKITKDIKDSLRKEIEIMCVNDQKFRWQIMLGEIDSAKLANLRNLDELAQRQRMVDVMKDRVGITKLQKDSLWVLQTFIDSTNFMRLSGIISNYGFPKKYIEIWKVSTILFHNSPTLMNEDFFKILKEEVSVGNLLGMEYAIMYDRVQNENHKPELYYVNKHYNSTTKTTIIRKPIDLIATNKARKEIGLKKLKE